MSSAVLFASSVQPLSQTPKVATKSTPRLARWMPAHLASVSGDSPEVDASALDAEGQEQSEATLLRQYYLNPARATVAKTFDFQAGRAVLEIGCGVGVLTRALTEQGLVVTAIEENGTLRKIAQEECSGLDTRFTHSIDELPEGQRFDYIVCIDPRFDTENEVDPVGRFLERSKRLLRPLGTLILTVGNTCESHGGVNVERFDHPARGSNLPLVPLQTLLGEIGYREIETFLAFPSHVAPLLVVNADRAKSNLAEWSRVVTQSYRGSSQATAALTRWWRSATESSIAANVAPGWVLLAHLHKVHDRLSPENVATTFEFASEESAPREEAGIRILPIDIDVDNALAQNVARPHLFSTLELTDQLDVAHSRVEDLLVREREVTKTFSQSEQSYGRKIDEATSELRKAKEQLRSETARADAAESYALSLAEQLVGDRTRVTELEAQLQASVSIHATDESIVSAQTETESEFDGSTLSNSAALKLSRNRGSVIGRLFRLLTGRK